MMLKLIILLLLNEIQAQGQSNNEVENSIKELKLAVRSLRQDVDELKNAQLKMQGDFQLKSLEVSSRIQGPAIACNGRPVKITCPTGQVVEIVKAVYGRDDTRICTNTSDIARQPQRLFFTNRLFRGYLMSSFNHWPCGLFKEGTKAARLMCGAKTECVVYTTSRYPPLYQSPPAGGVPTNCPRSQTRSINPYLSVSYICENSDRTRSFQTNQKSRIFPMWRFGKFRFPNSTRYLNDTLPDYIYPNARMRHLFHLATQGQNRWLYGQQELDSTK